MSEENVYQLTLNYRDFGGAIDYPKGTEIQIIKSGIVGDLIKLPDGKEVWVPKDFVSVKVDTECGAKHQERKQQ